MDQFEPGRRGVEDSPRTYLGDGVYASFDGYQVWLETLEAQAIAIEPETMAALIRYWASVQRWAEERNTK